MANMQDLFQKGHTPALHCAGKSPVGSYLPGMTLHPPVDNTNMQGTCIALCRENPVGSYLLGTALYSIGQKPKAPLGATKLNKSHDQQTAIKSYSACLLHFQNLCEPYDWLYPYRELYFKDKANERCFTVVYNNFHLTWIAFICFPKQCH